MREIACALIDLFYPSSCAHCGARTDSGIQLCAVCSRLVRRAAPPRCEICSHSLDGEIATAFACPNCRGRQFAFEFAVASCKAAGVVRELVHRLKYSREIFLARQLGEWICEGLEDQRMAGRHFDFIVPVPLHPVRRREREFNQAELLAERLSKRSGIRVLNCLRRVRPTRTQTQLDRRRRMRNLRDAFQLRQNARVDDLCLLLVDDVLTTGSTLNECARILLESGAGSVCAITVARG